MPTGSQHTGAVLCKSHDKELVGEKTSVDVSERRNSVEHQLGDPFSPNNPLPTDFMRKFKKYGYGNRPIKQHDNKT